MKEINGYSINWTKILYITPIYSMNNKVFFKIVFDNNQNLEFDDKVDRKEIVEQWQRSLMYIKQKSKIFNKVRRFFIDVLHINRFFIVLFIKKLYWKLFLAKKNPTRYMNSKEKFEFYVKEAELRDNNR
jgi:hypothetical protein